DRGHRRRSLRPAHARRRRNGVTRSGRGVSGRFVLGLGGHRPGARPVDAMREYLDGMDKAELALASPRPRRVLAALGPKMLDLAAERPDGAHPYFVPPEHTARAPTSRLNKPSSSTPIWRPRSASPASM